MKKLIKRISDFFTGNDIHSEFMAQYPILFFRYLFVIVFAVILVFGLLGKLD